MNERIRKIFLTNIKLIEKTDKAIYCFRCQRYDQAFAYIADSTEEMHLVLEEILQNREYFLSVEEASVIAMVEGILEAKKKGDFLLLADIYELQLSNLISRIQELIIEKEEFPYTTKIYDLNLLALQPKNNQLYEQLKEPEEPKILLDKGYAVEYTSCGLMTLAAIDEKGKFYFHSNSHVKQEAFFLAMEWAKKKAEVYHVLGLGLGYHIEELLEICKNAEVYIYESDFNIIRLTCNFVDLTKILKNPRVHFVYDKNLEAIRKAAEEISKKESVVVHYPSYRNLKMDKEFLEPYLPWIKILEDCV
ncbi:MAG: hypothetical protein RSB37_07800 [Acetivibrio sp.]